MRFPLEAPDLEEETERKAAAVHRRGTKLVKCMNSTLVLDKCLTGWIKVSWHYTVDAIQKWGLNTYMACYGHYTSRRQ
jgi:hypothetical protein